MNSTQTTQNNEIISNHFSLCADVDSATRYESVAAKEKYVFFYVFWFPSSRSQKRKKKWMKLLEQENETDSQIEESEKENNWTFWQEQQWQRQRSAIGKYKMIHKMPMSNCPFFVKFPCRKNPHMTNRKLEKLKRFVRARRFNLTEIEGCSHISTEWKKFAHKVLELRTSGVARFFAPFVQLPMIFPRIDFAFFLVLCHAAVIKISISNLHFHCT